MPAAPTGAFIVIIIITRHCYYWRIPHCCRCLSDEPCPPSAPQQRAMPPAALAAAVAAAGASRTRGEGAGAAAAAPAELATFARNSVHVP